MKYDNQDLFNLENWKSLNPNKRGDLAELIACQWLLMQGYEVFRNICCTGHADIIAHKKDENPIVIDVGVIGYINGCITDNKSINAQYRNKNVSVLYVMPDGSCKWRHDIENFKDIEQLCTVCGIAFISKKSLNEKRCTKHSYRGHHFNRGKKNK